MSLEFGDSGQEVTALQKALLAKGFNPGLIDGTFGHGTLGALLAFQEDNELLADGIVGRRTAQALGLAQPAAPERPTAAFTVDVVMKMFPDAKRANVERFLPPVLRALEALDLTPRSVVLGTLATIRAETSGFVPLSEFVSRFNTSPGGHAFDLYDNRRMLGNKGRPDGASFKGRGFVQLTGRFNYEKFGRIVGVDLVADPEKANAPDVAANILAAFIKACELRFKQALLAGDLAAARKCVNGGTHGLEQFTKAFKAGEGALAVLIVG